MASFLSGENYLALRRDPFPWVIQDLISSGGLTNIYGKPKTGKSFAALGMAASIASGKSDWLLQFPVLKHGPVAYLQLDTPRGEWASRIRDAKGYDFSNVFFCDMIMTPSFPFNALMPDQIEWLKKEMDLLKPAAVFIDTLREAHNGDENDSTIMRNVITGLQSACLPAAMVLVSHSRKDNMFSAVGGDDLMSDARGSSYVAGKMDCVVKFTEKHMAYKGRSAGSGSLNVQQNEDTGMIELVGEDATYLRLIRGLTDDLRREDPHCSINSIAKTIADHTTHRAIRTITTDVNRYLDACERMTRLRKHAAAVTAN